jgi:hypothetical protein
LDSKRNVGTKVGEGWVCKQQAGAQIEHEYTITISRQHVIIHLFPLLSVSFLDSKRNVGTKVGEGWVCKQQAGAQIEHEYTITISRQHVIIHLFPLLVDLLKSLPVKDHSPSGTPERFMCSGGHYICKVKG